jgi:transposase-like protein
MAKSKIGKVKKVGSGTGTPAVVKRRHPVGLRQQAVERMALGGSVTALARELGVNRNVLYYWREHPLGGPPDAYKELSAAEHQVRQLQGQVATLESSLGRKTLELDFFASALRRVGEIRQSGSGTGVPASTERSGSGPSGRKAD